MTPAPFGLSFTTIPHMAPFGTTGRHYTGRIPPVKAFFAPMRGLPASLHSAGHEPAIGLLGRGARPPSDSVRNGRTEEPQPPAPRSPGDSPRNGCDRGAPGPEPPPLYGWIEASPPARARFRRFIGYVSPLYRWRASSHGEACASGSGRRLGDDGQLALVEIGGATLAAVVQEDGADAELAGVRIPIRPTGEIPVLGLPVDLAIAAANRLRACEGEAGERRRGRIGDLSARVVHLIQGECCRPDGDLVEGEGIPRARSRLRRGAGLRGRAGRRRGRGGSRLLGKTGRRGR